MRILTSLSSHRISVCSIFNHALPLSWVRVVDICRRALLIEFFILVILFLIILIVEHFTAKQGHITFRQNLLVLSCRCDSRRIV